MGKEYKIPISIWEGTEPAEVISAVSVFTSHPQSSMFTRSDDEFLYINEDGMSVKLMDTLTNYK